MNFITCQRPLGAVVIGFASLTCVLGAQAQAAHPMHVRGAITSVEGSIVKVKTRDGKDVSLDLADSWAINGVGRASMSDIKQGSFIGTATMPASTDTMKAIEVVIFPEKLRGTGEGHYPWDLKPQSLMTNATVNNSVQDVDGQTVTLAYKGGEKKVTIGQDTPIVQIVDATKEDLAPGAQVFIATPSQTDGKLAKGAIVVGKDGLTPPM